MKTAIACIICNSPITRSRKGVAAPFLAKRIWGREPFNIDFAECEGCGFQFFNPRLEAEEEGHLYRNYRSDEYQQMRQSVEPWYTPSMNANLSSNDYLEVRKERLRQILREGLPEIQKPRILDFGGDRGQLVDDLYPGAEAFVYDISRVTPLPGVIACHSIEECASRKFDVIICSNALEHVGDPRFLSAQLFSIAGPDTLVFLEIPFESPYNRHLVLRRLVQFGVLAILRPRVAWALAGTSFTCVMHEHINFFNGKSLSALVQHSGGHAIAHGDYPLSGTQANGGRIGWCFGKKRKVLEHSKSQ